MSVDDLLFIIIFGGMLLAIAYLRAQYAMRRSHRIAERANMLRLRELYGTREKRRISAKAPRTLSPALQRPQYSRTRCCIGLCRCMFGSCTWRLAQLTGRKQWQAGFTPILADR